MRTLTSTFSSRQEAEAATRRLEAIGISAERITLKDVAPAGNSAEAGGGGVFLSVKVTTEQVEPAGGILRSQSPAAASVAVEPAPPPPAPAAAPVAQPIQDVPQPTPSFGHRPLPTPDPIPAPPPRAETAPQPRVAVTRQPAGAERAKLGRYLVYFALALLAAFMIGAWLGQVT